MIDIKQSCASADALRAKTCGQRDSDRSEIALTPMSEAPATIPRNLSSWPGSTRPSTPSLLVLIRRVNKAGFVAKTGCFSPAAVLKFNATIGRRRDSRFQMAAFRGEYHPELRALVLQTEP
jgi:hypothetical protein